MNAPGLLTLYQQLQTTALAWQSGDLVQFTAIQAAFQACLNHPEFSRIPAAERSTWTELQANLWDLMDDVKEGTWREYLRQLPRPDAHLEPLTASVTTPSEPESAAPPDRVDDYDHIIRDPKMLGQLCDEVKEHMDIAQFTLVDLEYDPTNAENINKIFRAFHTIKSSAAFLGLKNLEEAAHAIEDVMVLVRDGVLPIDKDLITVIFTGVGILKDLVAIIERSQFDVDVMVASFRQLDLTSSIEVFHKIHRDHGRRKIGQILLEQGRLDASGVAQVLEVQERTQGRFGTIAVEQRLISEDDLRASLRQQGMTKKVNFVKVSNDRLNALIDIVGELVVNQSMLRQYLQHPESARETGERTFTQLEAITTNIKNLVLSMGMVPIAEIFNKLRVVIRNTATETGKTVNAEFQGSETELDRNVIESIYDPLVHIVRNAVDHGIEAPAERLARGKPAMGTLVVSAEHRGNSIEISVQDNGEGIDPARVIAKALANGLITEEASLSMTEKDIHGLLMLPGFSTKETVTEVSGRGVGLDVVKQNVEQIHGKVEIQSQWGQGTRFLIRIPLTLAIIDGFVTVIDDTKYIFPFNLIEEIIVPEPSALSRLDNGQILLFERGIYTPVIVAADLFGHPSRAEPWKLVVILGYEGKRYGIAVDAILGKQEIVIKTLNEALAQLKLFSGGTIFGDGSIGFVVDIETFVHTARTDHTGGTA